MSTSFNLKPSAGTQFNSPLVKNLIDTFSLRVSLCVNTRRPLALSVSRLLLSHRWMAEIFVSRKLFRMFRRDLSCPGIRTFEKIKLFLASLTINQISLPIENNVCQWPLNLLYRFHCVTSLTNLKIFVVLKYLSVIWDTFLRMPALSL